MANKTESWGNRPRWYYKVRDFIVVNRPWSIFVIMGITWIVIILALLVVK